MGSLVVFLVGDGEIAPGFFNISCEIEFYPSFTVIIPLAVLLSTKIVVWPCFQPISSRVRRNILPFFALENVPPSSASATDIATRGRRDALETRPNHDLHRQ